MYKLYEKKEIYRKKKITQDDCLITVFYDKQLGPTIKMSINDVSKTISYFDYEKFRFKNVILNADSEHMPQNNLINEDTKLTNKVKTIYCIKEGNDSLLTDCTIV